MPEENKEKIILTKRTIQQLEERRQQIEKELSTLLEQKEPLEIKGEQILTEINQLEEKLKPVLKEEEEIEKEKEEIEKKEKVAISPEKKREIEELRWKIEERRHEMERTKWQREGEIKTLKERKTAIDFEYQKIIREEGKLKREREEILAMEKKIGLEKKWKKIEREISLLGEKIEETSKKVRECKENLTKTLKEEEEIENKIKDIEKEEREVVLPTEKEKIERQRWEKEKERKEIEEKRWQQQEEKEKMEAELKREQANYQKLLAEQENLDREIKEIEIFLGVPKVKEPPQKEEEIPEIKEEIEEPEMEEIKEEIPEEMPEEIKEEKLELLKREEIKTMQKDIARLREIEAQKERERITALKTEERPRPTPPPPAPVPPIQPPIPPTPPREEEKKIPLEILIPKPPAIRPYFFQKVLVRGVVLLLCLLLLGFFYWFFAVKKPPSPEGPPSPSPEIVEKPKIIIPPSLISVAETKILEISEIEEIPEKFKEVMKEDLGEGTFTRLTFKNVKENRLFTLKDLSQAFQIEVPEEVFDKLEENYTFSLYSQKQGKRVALVVRVKETEGLNELLKNRETKTQQEGIFISGQKISTLVPYFRTAVWQGLTLRYLTISRQDLGICYALSDNYFVFTNSFESLKKIIEELTLEKKLGQLFIVGFEGKTLTPQLEEFFKKYKPGGLLLLSKNIESREQLKNLISGLQNLSLKETGLPLFIAVDQEGEPLSRIGFLEEKTGQSEIKDAKEAYQVGKKRGEELKESGVNLNLAPVLDLAKEGDFIFNRSFQKSPEIVGELAKSLILGQRGAGILTAMKHFPGYVNISFNPEDQLAKVNLPEISQFKKAMEANPELVMAVNGIYEEVDPVLPFTFSKKGISFLKSNLGSEILIISDDLAQNSLLRNFSLKEVVTKPLEVGVDILIFSGWRVPVEQGLDSFFEAVKNKEVSEERINEAILKITQLKENLLK